MSTVATSDHSAAAATEPSRRDSRSGSPAASQHGRVAADHLRTLTILRWWAILGQGLTIVLAVHGLQVHLDTTPLWAGIAALAMFNVVAWMRQPAAPVRPAVAAMHLGVDIAQLAWMVGFSGGAMNPFVSLFLVPVALATLALPAAWIWAVAAASSLGYALAAILGRPLPHVHGSFGSTFDLHLWGMAVTFLLAALIFVLVLTRLARLREQHDSEVARLRERAARSEGILGLATQAAATAHALNTPLATLTLVLDDLQADARLAAELEADVERARQVVRVCRDRLRQLVEQSRVPVDARAAAAGSGDGCSSLDSFVHGIVDSWSLLRPQVRLDRRIDLPARQIRAEPSLSLLIQALLDNAADASLANGQNEVRLDIGVETDRLCVAIRDRGGPGLDRRMASGRLFASNKPGGLGLGLALSHASVETLGGELHLCPTAEGASTRMRLPLSALDMAGESASTKPSGTSPCAS